jgi:hypothetical protein
MKLQIVQDHILRHLLPQWTGRVNDAKVKLKELPIQMVQQGDQDAFRSASPQGRQQEEYAPLRLAWGVLGPFGGRGRV